MRRFASISLVLVLLLGACSDASQPEVAEQTTPEPVETEQRDKTPDRPEPAETKLDAKEKLKRKREGRDAAEDPSSESEASSQDGGGDGGSVFNDGENEDDDSSALHPAAGRYVYAQRGYERFCQAATCDQQDLPARQPVDVKIRGRNDRGTVVVMDIHSSDNRLVRTTTVFSRANALVSDVYLRFAYEGFTFENSYQPRPPVETLRFPLKKGAGWSGTWEDSTSGDYSVDVLGRDGLRVGGKAIDAYKLAMVTNFSGEFTGSSKAIVWVDAATKTTVRTSGKIDVRSSFGRYISEFNTTLRSGPRYR